MKDIIYICRQNQSRAPLLGEVPLEQSDASLALCKVDPNPISSTRYDEMTVQERPPATQCKPLFFTADSVA